MTVDIRTPPGADRTLNSVVTQIREAFTRTQFPLEPRRTAIFEDTASLPAANAWEGAIVYIRDIGSSTPMLAYSDGTDWRRADTNGTL